MRPFGATALVVPWGAVRPKHLACPYSSTPAKPTWVRHRAHNAGTSGSSPEAGTKFNTHVAVVKLAKALRSDRRDSAGSSPASDTNKHGPVGLSHVRFWLSP